MSTKLIGILVALAVLGGVAYVYTSKDTNTKQMEDSNTAAIPGTEQVAVVPAQSGSVDDLTALIDSELAATAAGIGAIDAETDASVSAIQQAGDSSRLYDPNNL
jgi:uncharacterized membrane protein YebE (DUF533 family)